MRWLLFWNLFLGGCLPPTVWADVVHLTDGRKVEGIVVGETDSGLRVQVTWQGFVTLDREDVLSAVRSSDQENSHRLRQWRKEFLEDQARQRKRDSFEAFQKRRGLVPYEGEWVSPEEKSRREQKKKETEEAKQKPRFEIPPVEAIPPPITQPAPPQRIIAGDKVFILPRSGFVIQRQNRDPTLYKDERGNLIRVRKHEGHKFFTTTEGVHVDLESHGGHLFFNDKEGTHHDLEPVK